MKPVVLDNTVLSNLALVAQADLVFQLWAERACSTQAVLDEYHKAAAAGLLPPEAWADLPIVPLDQSESAFAGTLSARLGAGERSCIAVARFRQGVLVSDDADARAVALKDDIVVTGTVGLLVLGIRRGLMTLAEGNAWLAEMIAAGYRAPVVRLDGLIG